MRRPKRYVIDPQERCGIAAIAPVVRGDQLLAIPREQQIAQDRAPRTGPATPPSRHDAPVECASSSAEDSGARRTVPLAPREVDRILRRMAEDAAALPLSPELLKAIEHICADEIGEVTD